MTTGEIKNLLSVWNLDPNKWHTLEGIAHRVYLLTDNSLFVEPQKTQFYFDVDVNNFNDNEFCLIYERFTQGSPILKTDENNEYEDNPDYVIVEHDDKEYYLKLEGGGVDSDFGRIHDMISSEIITGFLQTNQKP